ncbi:GAF domain-containing protein [Pedobacter sp. GR22-6]|uniref:GAF domain-containing protein n=1 Tax=Pedobacter sp. GR22-6 TaxID=3127957 RepID=UPI00307EC9DA
MPNLSTEIQTPFQITFSFEEVIKKLEASLKNHTAANPEATKSLLDQVEKYPQLRDGITDLTVLLENEALIGQLLIDYLPPELTLNEIKAIGIPYINTIFNLSDRFKNIMRAAGKDFEIEIRDFDEHQFFVLSCCIILNNVYGRQLDFSKPIFYDIPTADGVTRHYRILYNGDFLDILPTEKTVHLSEAEIDELVDNYDNIELWRAKFPLESWTLKGFAIMTLYDATVENAVSIFKEKLLDFNTPNFNQSITSVYRSIYRIPDLRIGFTLFNQDQGKFSTTGLAYHMVSHILPDKAEQLDKDILCLPSYRQLVHNKKYFAASDTQELQLKNAASPLMEIMLKQGIRSFILAPIVKNGRLLGVLEVVSERPKELNSINANKLDVIMPFLTEKVDRLVVELENAIQALIQLRFTTLHPSVNWKFRDQAKQLLLNQGLNQETALEDIVFPNIFPLYGQIDVKGSSEARNLSVQNDLQLQLKDLFQLLKGIQNEDAADFSAEIEQISRFRTWLQSPILANTEHQIVNYLDQKIHDRLRDIKHRQLDHLIRSYFSENEMETGIFHTYRRKYERTISRINLKMAEILDMRQLEAQKVFPHYFERFKTDGVEHNLYIGASIAPQFDFNRQILRQLRLWQLRTMCEMERAHQQLMPSLPYALPVTSLILVYNSTIAIRFRMDEKRFDVDGSYNARFEIVKKRIDKAYIKDTTERITESGKITIVYSDETDEAEYLEYVAELQQEQILKPEVERFDIEDLQGVSGLKGLRAAMIY